MRAQKVRRLILQPTSYCNIQCDYCYLADRDVRRVMPISVVEAVGRTLAASGLAEESLEVRWHSGEPLTVPSDFYREAHAVLTRTLAPATQPWFSVQTNGTLIDDRWCELFQRLDISVGVSIDGPDFLHDSHRLTRQGRGTHIRTMRGITRLREHGIAFDTISVVTEETLRNIPAFLDFLTELSPRSVGVNPEETEGDHSSALFSSEGFRADFTAFLATLHEWQEETGIPVRRLSAMRDMILRGQLPARNEQIEPLAMLSVDADGNMSTFSPELLTWSAPEFDDFVLGNVLDPGASLTTWSPGFAAMAAQVEEGKRMCERSCEYFSLCGGGAAGNKWAENGSFASTRTAACQTQIMAVADVVLAALEARAA